MSIVIDYDMPSSCFECVGIYGHHCRFREGVSTKGHGDDRPLACPIIGEITDKHGRLIDADKLMEKVREEADFPSYEWCKAIECLEDAPTVLGASE